MASQIFVSKLSNYTCSLCWKIPEKSFVGNWGVILVALKPYVWHWKLLIYEDCFLSWIDLHHVKSSVVAQSIISSEDSWVDPSTNATQLTEKYKQQLGADKFILHATTVFLNTKWWWSKINKEAFGQEKKVASDAPTCSGQVWWPLLQIIFSTAIFVSR